MSMNGLSHSHASGFTGVTGATGQTGVTGARTLLPLVSSLILKSVHDHKAMGDKVSLVIACRR